MRYFKPIPSQDSLHEMLDYDEETGAISWRTGQLAGSRTGRIDRDGYVTIRTRKLGFFFAHRIAWVYVYGAIPDGMQIDHIDGDRANNAISNLRPATQSQNSRNSRARVKSRSGLKGAHWNHRCEEKPWRSHIRVDGKYKYLGTFETPEQANAAYQAAAVVHYGEFARSK